MDLDSFFGWYFTHNTLLINAVIVAILGLIALVLFFSLSKGKNANQGSLATSGAIDDLEKTLRRVLDQVPSKTAVQAQAGLIQDDEGSTKQAVQAAAAHAAAAEFQNVVETLKKDVGEKDRVIQTLKVDLDKIASTGGLTEDQKKRISSLERELEQAKSRLSEYEIIEDDIANLSLYKAENSQLKNELDKLRRTKVIKDDPKNIPQVSDIVAEFAAIVGAGDNPRDPAAYGASKSAEPVKDMETIITADPVKTDELVRVAGAPAEADDGSALAIDPNKLIAEATSLPDVTDTEDDGKEEDSKQKLINEFESFIKNG